MENKYPYIGQSDVTGNVVLLTSQGCGYFIECDRCERVGRLSGKIHETYFKNITADYLRNTKIRIESQEHGAFVQKLVFGAGGKWLGVNVGEFIGHADSAYLFISNELVVTSGLAGDDDLFACKDSKEIKLPMPPSQLPEVSIETPMPKVKPPKQASDEWPKVGDVAVLVNEHNRKVRHGFEAINQKVKVMALFKDNDVDMAVIKYDITNYCFRADMLIKPPTPQEKLTNEIYNQIGSKDDSYALAKAILAGEIEGLVYKGD